LGDPTVLEALSFAKKGDRSLRPSLEAAYNRTSDLGLIAKTFWTQGEDGIAALKITVGRPIRPQLAERLPNPEAVINKLGAVVVQPKYDGIRVQIHKNGANVRVFSRNLEDFSLMFVELVAAAKKLKDRTLILDGEAIGYNPESEEYVMFQQTASRRRQHGIEEAAASLPLVAFVFDVLYRNGKDLTPLPYGERYALLGEVLGGSTVLTPAPLTTTSSAEELTKTLLDNISKGLEGVVVKRMDSPYQAGARNFNWVKLKRTTSGQLNDTVDLVLLGYYFGKGKRTSFGLGALLAGVYDAEHDRFDTITKIGTGLSDAGWREIHQRADKLQVKERPARVRSLLTPDVWLKPEVVVEVLADEITPGTNHTAGKVGDDPAADPAGDARADAPGPPSPEQARVQLQQLREQITREERGRKQRDRSRHRSEIRQDDRADRRVVDDEQRREPQRKEDEQGGHGVLRGADDGPQRARGDPEAGHLRSERAIDRPGETTLDGRGPAQRRERAAERRRPGGNGRRHELAQRLDRRRERAAQLPAPQKAGRVGRGPGPTDEPVDRARDKSQRTRAASARREPGRRDGLALEARDVGEGQRAARDRREGAPPARRLDQRSGGVAQHTRPGGELARCLTCPRGDSRRDHALGLDPGIEPLAQLADAARTLSRARRDDLDVARAFAAELVAHVLGDAGR